MKEFMRKTIKSKVLKLLSISALCAGQFFTVAHAVEVDAVKEKSISTAREMCIQKCHDAASTKETEQQQCAVNCVEKNLSQVMQSFTRSSSAGIPVF
jgi:hypothetical protein